MSDARDQTSAVLTEQLLKDAWTKGVAGFVDAIMQPAQYGALGSSVNRATMIAFFEGLRSLPFRLPSYLVGSLPAANGNVGALVYVADASGGAIVAFSDGSDWLRVDTRAVVT